jgi:hypothetical protein
LTAIVPYDIPEELYDLVVYGSGEVKDISCRSVKIINDFKDSYYFIHITDIHTNPFGDWRGDTNKIFEKIIKEINLINPEFVLLTGDFVGSGNPGNYTHFLSILSNLEVPIYIIPGNHEIMNDTTSNGVNYPFYCRAKADYEKYIGPLYYDFKYNNHLYLGFFTANFGLWTDREGNPATGFRLEKSKSEWILEELEKYTNSSMKIFFNHFPSARLLADPKQLPKFDEYDLRSLYDNYKIIMELFGHQHQDALVTVESSPILLVQTAGIQKQDKLGYRLIRIKEDNIMSFSYDNDPIASIPWGNLDVSIPSLNIGLANEVTAIVTNKLNEHFENSLIKFTVPNYGSHFTAENGDIFQIIDNNIAKTVYVKIKIKPKSTEKIKIAFQIARMVEEELRPAHPC